MTSEQEAELAQRRLQNAIAFDSGCVNSAKKVAFIDVLAENERLKEAIRRLAEQDATLSVCNGSVTVEIDATLTDAEREAVDRQAKWLVNQAKNKPDIHSADLLLQEAATLRGLLERTKCAPNETDGYVE